MFTVPCFGSEYFPAADFRDLLFYRILARLPRELVAFHLLLDIETFEGDFFSEANLHDAVDALPWRKFFERLQRFDTLRALSVGLRWTSPSGVVSWTDETRKLVTNNSILSGEGSR